MIEPTINSDLSDIESQKYYCLCGYIINNMLPDGYTIKHIITDNGKAWEISSSVGLIKTKPKKILLDALKEALPKDCEKRINNIETKLNNPNADIEEYVKHCAYITHCTMDKSGLFPNATNKMQIFSNIRDTLEMEPNSRKQELEKAKDAFNDIMLEYANRSDILEDAQKTTKRILELLNLDAES
jgi:hypothetical protein